MDTILNEWNEKEISRNASQDVPDPALDEEDVVMLLQGKNSFNKRVYCYLKLSINNLKRLKESLINKDPFMPSDFGEVLAAGEGAPPPELRAEMAVKYGLMQSAQPQPQKPAIMQKPLWGE